LIGSVKPLISSAKPAIGVDVVEPEAAHEIVDLGRRTLPVLAGEAVEITAGGLRSQ